MDTPVYLFTGFLDAGKTSFIQKTLEDERFNQGENTLLLLCEEGEADYAPERFSGARIFAERIEAPEELTAEGLDRLRRKHACERVIVEYNGMWKLDALYSALPEGWMVYQEFCFADARSFFTYNANLRELMVDKLLSCEMLVLNRAFEGFDRMELHRLVRALNRRAEIAYEAEDGSVSYDDIPDELPYDLEAPLIDLSLDNYAAWYRDLSEEMEKYEGKKVRLEGYVVRRKDLPAGSFIFGRQVMTCCAEDTSFAGVLCLWKDAATLSHRDWVTVTAEIILQDHKVYGRRGPVLRVLAVEPAAPPADAVATFY